MIVLLLCTGLNILTTSAGCPFSKGIDAPANYHDPGCSPSELKEIKSSVSPDPHQTTNKGCKCTSSCGATVDFNAATCDWCFTADKCGMYSYSRFAYYDYCAYPANQTYESHTHQWKINYLWTKITDDPKPGTFPNPLGIMSESAQTSFDDMWDVMPNGRSKFIHAIGAVCQIRWLIQPNSPYTGLFSPGEVLGLVRMGSAQPVNFYSGLTPGMGFKFLRSGVPSGNFVALHSLQAQKGYNFFQKNVSNHIGPPSGATIPLVAKFLQASRCPTQVGLSDMASWTQNGETESDPVFPFQLVFEPSGQVSTSKKSNQGQLDEMKAIANGTLLYTIKAYKDPAASKSGVPELLGLMYTASNCVSSKFGDEKLFIRHQRMEEDWEFMQVNNGEDWVSQMNPYQDCGHGGSLSLDPPMKCSCFEEDVARVQLSGKF